MASWQEDKYAWGVAAAALIAAGFSVVSARSTFGRQEAKPASGSPGSPPTTGSAGSGGSSGTPTGFAHTATGLFTRTQSPASRSAHARIATRAAAARSSHEFLKGVAVALANEGAELHTSGMEAAGMDLFDIAGSLDVVANGLLDVAE